MTTATNQQTQTVKLDRLDAHPLNPRARITQASVAGLAELIKANGQLSPLLVREMPGERYQVLDGNRRRIALEVLGLEAATVIARVFDDGQALATMLSANEEREDVDPFREAATLEALVTLDGSVKHAAARIGKSVRWVAQRLSLLGLSEKWQKERESEPLSKWPAAAWEIVARLSIEAQDQMHAQRDGRLRHLFQESDADLSQLEDEVKEHLRVIGKAPFDPEDAKLLRGVPPCSSCPKTSQSAPGLFDDGAPTELKSATCRDSGCWGKKAAATLRVKVAEARARAGESAPIVLRQGAEAKAAGRALPSTRWEETKKDAKGASAVVIVGAAGGVTVGFGRIKSDPYAVSYSSKPKKETPAEALGRLEDLHRDAIEKAIDDVVGAAAKESLKTPPAALHVVACALACGTGDDWQVKREPKAAAERLIERYTGGGSVNAPKVTLEDLCDALWPFVVESFSRNDYGEPEDLKAQRCAFATALKLDLPKIASDAEKDTKPSKELVQARARVEKANSAWENGKPVELEGGVAASKGVCRECGCTMTTPCSDGPQGCSWVDEHETKCSSCFDENGKLRPQPRGKRHPVAKAKGKKLKPADTFKGLSPAQRAAKIRKMLKPKKLGVLAKRNAAKRAKAAAAK